jgi:hypothetical protein
VSQSFSDAVETTVDRNLNTFESSASNSSISDYLPLRGNFRSINETKREERRLVDLFLAIPAPIGGLSKSGIGFTSIASGNDRITGIVNKPSYEITEAVELFIRKQKKWVKYKEDILNVADRVAYFLREKGIKAEVNIDLFTDPEYTNWIEPKIQVVAKKEQLQKAYETYDELLNYAYRGISQKTLSRLSVTIDSER